MTSPSSPEQPALAAAVSGVAAEPAAPHPSASVHRNALWGMSQQVVTLGSTAVTSVLVARSMSVEDFGRFSYALNLMSLATTVMVGGLGGLAVKSILEASRRGTGVLASLLVIREGLALAAYVSLGVIALGAGDRLTTSVSLIALVTVFARAADVADLWFQATLETRRTAAPRIGVILGMLVAKAVLALTVPDLVLFIWLQVLEAVLCAVLVGAGLRRSRPGDVWGAVDRRVVRGLLASSWVLLVSSIFAQVNSRADVLVLQWLRGAVDVAQYSAAARVSEIGYFIPAAYMAAAFPGLLALRRTAGAQAPEYRKALQRSYTTAFWVGVLLAGVLYLAGPWGITLVFGLEYAPAGEVLRVHVLALPFVFMAAVFSKWILAESLYWASLLRHGLGAVANVVLNLVWVPAYGIQGAAWATVVSYVLASYLSCLVGARTRAAGAQMTRAILAPVLFLVSKVVRTP